MNSNDACQVFSLVSLILCAASFAMLMRLSKPSADTLGVSARSLTLAQNIQSSDPVSLGPASTCSECDSVCTGSDSSCAAFPASDNLSNKDKFLTANNGDLQSRPMTDLTNIVKCSESRMMSRLFDFQTSVENNLETYAKKGDLNNLLGSIPSNTYLTKAQVESTYMSKTDMVRDYADKAYIDTNGLMNKDVYIRMARDDGGGTTVWDKGLYAEASNNAIHLQNGGGPVGTGAEYRFKFVSVPPPVT